MNKEHCLKKGTTGLITMIILLIQTRFHLIYRLMQPRGYSWESQGSTTTTHSVSLSWQPVPRLPTDFRSTKFVSIPLTKGIGICHRSAGETKYVFNSLPRTISHCVRRFAFTVRSRWVHWTSTVCVVHNVAQCSSVYVDSSRHSGMAIHRVYAGCIQNF